MDLQSVIQWLTRVEQRVISLENKLTSYDSYFSNIKNRLDAQGVDINRQNAHIAELTLKITNLEARIAAQDIAHASLVNDIKSLVQSKPKPFYKIF